MAPRLLIEVCCGPRSKLGDSRYRDNGDCRVVRITILDDFRLDTGLAKAMNAIDEFHGPPSAILAWISLPCTGGCAWQHVNLIKVKDHKVRMRELFKEFQLLFVNVKVFTQKLSDVGAHFAYEWPRGCAFWRLPVVQECTVTRLLLRLSLRLTLFQH